MSHRIVHDTIHGTYYLPHLLWKIIDSKYFQRLRRIKQNGNVYWVYPGATHTRFDHCLGVSHLAGLLAKKLHYHHPDLITPRHILCLQIAGLCHDLGHGPISHLFEHFIDDPHFSHEYMGYQILQLIVSEYNLDLSSRDLELIGKMIVGYDGHPNFQWTSEDQRFKFLYEVIANGRNGIDVDKFDYILRDSYYTGISCGFNPQRLMEFARINQDDSGSYVISYDHKAQELINDMWKTRSDLHRRIYQHRVVKVIDQMTLDTLNEYRDQLISEDLILKESYKSPEVYSMLTDDLLIQLPVQDYWDRLWNRQLYITVAVLKVKIENLSLLPPLDNDKFVLIKGFRSDTSQIMYLLYRNHQVPLEELKNLYQSLSPEDLDIYWRRSPN